MVFKFVACTLVLYLVTMYALSVIKLMNPYGVVYNHTPGPCHVVQDVVHGSEDMQLLPNGNGTALITSGLNLKIIFGVDDPYWKDRKGQILLFDYNTPKQKPIALKIKGNLNLNTFHPHGISIWADKSGKVYVYVVNHVNGTTDLVEKFLYVEKKKELQYLKSISDPNFQVLNDLVVFGEDRFYTTNFFVSRTHWVFQIEQNTFRPWGNVVYFDGKDSKIVAKGLTVPNGINLSPDKKHLYVAHFQAQEILTYKILPENELEQIHAFPVGTMADNLDIDPVTGDIWTAGHPLGFPVMAFLDHPDPTISTTPSHVLYIKVKDGVPVSMKEVYADDGGQLQCSSVAVKYKNGLLVGTVYNGLVYCDIKHM